VFFSASFAVESVIAAHGVSEASTQFPWLANWSWSNSFLECKAMVISPTVCTKKNQHAGSAILLPFFFFQRFRLLGATGPKFEGTKIASAFSSTDCFL